MRRPTLFPEGLLALGFAVQGNDLTHPLRGAAIAGWTPGCEGRPSWIDSIASDARREALILVRRQRVNGWHRELQAAVGRLLLGARARETRRRLRALVPDRALAARLPARLTREPACDGPRRERRHRRRSPSPKAAAAAAAVVARVATRAERAGG